MPKYVFNIYGTIETPPPTLQLVTTSVPNAIEDEVYSLQFEASGGTLPYTWSLIAPNNTIPLGMNFSSGGLFDGTPANPGTFPLNFRVTDNLGATVNTGVVNFQVVPANTLAITTISLPAAHRGEFYSQQLVAINNTGAVTWSMVAPNNTLPSGLSLVGNRVEGTPDVAGSVNVVFRAADSITTADSGVIAVIVQQVQNLSITTGITISPGEATTSTSRTFETAGGWGDVDWVKTTGTFPTGMSFDGETGVLSGTPTTPATYAFTLQATDSEGRTATKSFTFNIVAAGTVVGPHEAYDAWIAEADYWKGISFRPIPGRPKLYASGIHTGKMDPYYANQLAVVGSGGYSDNNSKPPSVTYDYAGDTDPNKQDAGRAVIPPFGDLATKRRLSADVDASQTTFPMYGQPDELSNSIDNGTALKFDDEVVITTQPKTKFMTSVTVARGQFGTTPAAHLSQTAPGASGTSLPNQIRFKLDTVPGNRYLFVVDFLYTDTWLRKPEIGELKGSWLKNHKQLQFTGMKPGGQIFQESATRFTASGDAPSPNPLFDNTIHVCEFDWRTYQELNNNGLSTFDPLNPYRYPADGTTAKYPMRPINGPMFIIHPNRWTRLWIEFEFVIDNWDLLTVYIADEVQEPFQVFNDFRFKAFLANTIISGVIDANGKLNEFWLELDTSDKEHFRLDNRDLISYWRNLVMFENHPVDWSARRIKPVRDTI